MGVEVFTVHTREDLKEFVYLPEKIHAEHANWIPPIYSDEFRFYDPKHNHSLAGSDSILFLAHKDSQTVGRIMGIVCKPYNERHKEKTCRFFNLDCYNDNEVSHALINAVMNWAAKKGMKKLIGPFGFSDKDPQGLQIEGHEHLPVIATATNLPYLQTLVENEGFSKMMDGLVYKLNVPDQIPENYQRVYDKLIRSKNFKLVEFHNKKKLKPYILPVLRLVNETFRSIFGFMEMNDDEMIHLSNRYIHLLDPLFTKLVVDNDNKPLAFVVATPDISHGIQLAKGKLFPFGFVHILAAARETRQLDLLLGAVKDNCRNKGLTALLGISLLKSAKQRELSYIDSHFILETNNSMRNVMERLDGKVYKRYRIYMKDID